MDFQAAAATQYNRHTYYSVVLASPTCLAIEHAIRLGSTQRRTGNGLLSFIGRDAVQAIIKKNVPDAETATIIKKTKDMLVLSNGWKITFGGTIRQDAAR